MTSLIGIRLVSIISFEYTILRAFICLTKKMMHCFGAFLYLTLLVFVFVLNSHNVRKYFSEFKMKWKFFDFFWERFWGFFHKFSKTFWFSSEILNIFFKIFTIFEIFEIIFAKCEGFFWSYLPLDNQFNQKHAKNGEITSWELTRFIRIKES